MSKLSFMAPDEPHYLVDDDPQPDTYRGFTISYEFPPVPTRDWDWAAYRTNDPEGGFRAYGRTYDECKREIDALLDD